MLCLIFLFLSLRRLGKFSGPVLSSARAFKRRDSEGGVVPEKTPPEGRDSVGGVVPEKTPPGAAGATSPPLQSGVLSFLRRVPSFSQDERAENGGCQEKSSCLGLQSASCVRTLLGSAGNELPVWAPRTSRQSQAPETDPIVFQARVRENPEVEKFLAAPNAELWSQPKEIQCRSSLAQPIRRLRSLPHEESTSPDRGYRGEAVHRKRRIQLQGSQ